MKIKRLDDGAMFLHEEIADGKLPDTRKFRLIMNNQGLILQIYYEDKKKLWKSYAVTWENFTKDLIDKVLSFEKNEASK